MNGVFGWMAGGLAITAAMAWFFASSGAITLLYNEMGGMSMMGWVVTLAPLGFILAMNFGLQRMSAASLALLFVAFSATMGSSLSSVFLVYSMGSLTQVFGITAGIKHNTAVREARRRGASRILLHFSPLGSQARLNAAQDLWLAIRSPLVSWATAPLHRFG